MEGKILAADIGGTHSRFSWFSVTEDGQLRMEENVWLPTREASSFGTLLARLEQSGFRLPLQEADIASFAVAGPVESTTYCNPPLISWDVNLDEVSPKFGLGRACLLNDFVAQACSCLTPVGRAARRIHPGTAVPGACLAVLGAGTGLGKAVLVPDGTGGYIPQPSEGGHAAFPFNAPQEYEFQEFMKAELGEEVLTGNMVVSGRGLVLLHRFLTGETVEERKMGECMRQASQTLEWAARFYGRVCRNYALETLSRGGLFVAGGVAARSPELIASPAFLDEFRMSSTLRRILESMPVYLIDNQDSGLWGAAWYGLQLLRKERV